MLLSTPIMLIEPRYTVSLGNPIGEKLKAPESKARLITDDPDTWTEHECLARNAYFEARGEGEHGMALVTQTVLNRMNSNKRYFPNTACQVVRQKIGKTCAYSWFCDGKSDRPKDLKLFEKAKIVADKAIMGYYTNLVKVKYYKRCDVESGFFDTLEYKFRYKNHCYFGEV